MVRARALGFLPLLRKLRRRFEQRERAVEVTTSIESMLALPRTSFPSFRLFSKTSSHAPVRSDVIRLTHRRAVRTSASGGSLVESRGEIVKVRFEARASFSEDETRAFSEEALATLRKPFTTWLPVECVAIVTPWE